MTAADTDSLIDCVSELALDIARLCPDCAEKAQQLVSLVGQIRSRPLDRGAIQDAIGCEMVDTDLSDAQVRTTTEAVLRAAADDPED